MGKNRFEHKLHVRKGDRVVVISGADKGVEGEILQVFPKKQRVVVDGVNVKKKHMKPTQDNAGGITEINAPIHISNVLHIDPKSGEPTRIGRRIENGKLVRYAKKSGETIG
ncbi:MAG: 50S ribosomal protein L24 [Bacteroidota bacterium]